MMNNLKKLIQHLSDGQFHSGVELGKQLNITRSAIWKLMEQAKTLGIEIESTTTTGYRIPNGLELLNSENIQQYLHHRHANQPNSLEIFDQINSTNDYLMGCISAMQPKDHRIRVCLAEQQSRGKGRLGRQWLSPFGVNIYLSVLFPFTKDIAELSGLSLAVATIVADVLSEIGLKTDIGLKWPNDILWKNRKLVGILIETAGETHGTNYAVIGIGINVNMRQSTASAINQPWISIREIDPNAANRNQLAGLLIDRLIEQLNRFQQEGFTSFQQRFQALDILMNQPITLITPLNEISGIARGIDERGRLKLEDEQGKQHIFSVGDVSIKKKSCEQ